MKREEVRKTFNDLMLGDYDFDEIYKFAKQLMDNGPTTEEVKGFIDSTADRVVELNPKLPKDKKIVVVCRSGNRSQEGRDILLTAGFNATSMTGGLQEWYAKGYPIEGAPQ